MNHFQATSIDSLIDNYIIVFSGLLLVMFVMLMIRLIDRFIFKVFHWSPLDYIAYLLFRQ